MHTSAPWRARLRPEYRWPYPTLDPNQWYAIRSSWAVLEPGKWIWLESEPYAVEVLADHLEPIQRGVPTDGSVPSVPDPEAGASQRVEVRVARLRDRAARLYPGLPLGAWVVASELVLALGAGRVPGSSRQERRRRRLTSEHFEFRTDVLDRA